MRGVFNRYIDPERRGVQPYIGPESQEEASESLKCSIALAIDVLF
jgi:hypothetical protein